MKNPMAHYELSLIQDFIHQTQILSPVFQKVKINRAGLHTIHRGSYRLNMRYPQRGKFRTQSLAVGSIPRCWRF